MCDREEHIKETKKQLGGEEVYEEPSKDAISILETINAVRSDLKINIFPFAKKALNQKWWTAIGSRFPPPYSISFMEELDEEIIK